GRVELESKRTTEQGLEQSKELDTYEVNAIIKLMNQEDKTVAYSVEKVLPDIEMVIYKVIDKMRSGGRLYYIGAGSSGRMGILDASECPPTFGVDANLVTGIIAGGDWAIRRAIEDAEDNKEAGKEDILQTITNKDVLIGITASGITPYVIGAIEAANEIGAVTAGISCNHHTPLSKAAQYPVEVQTVHEILTGSTRLKAGTAQKFVLNMIKTNKDELIGITASGITPYVIGAIEAANEIGAVTAGISCNHHTPLSKAAQYPVEVQTGPEILTGSTRLKAGTAQKFVLNMITTTT